MKIQIWSDYRCPFCYIGKRNLENALKELEGEFEIEMMSYELDPNHEPSDLSEAESLAQKYGISVQEAKQRLNQVVNMAKGVGLNYDFDNIVDVNTVNPHKVLQYAKIKNLGNEFSEKLFEAHFINGKNIDDIEFLVEIGKDIGLDEEGIRNAYGSDDYLLKVRQDEQWASMIGVRGVPHFVIDNAVSLSGAQPKETFKDAIAYTVDYLAKQDNTSDDLTCTDDSCAI